MKLTRILTLISVGVFITLFATPTFSQILRNQNRYSKSEVGRMISNLETSSDRFRRDFDRAMDNSNLNGTSAEDRFNGYVSDYENALDRLRNEFDRSNSWWTTRNQVSQMISSAYRVNDMMNTLSFRRSLETQWRAMRDRVNTLADTYDLAGVGGGGWNGGWGGGSGGGWVGNQSRPPSWASGTFYGTAPNGSQITLTIADNGAVTAMVGGSPSYGSYSNGTININGAQARVSRNGDGIVTVRSDNRERIVYSRTTWNGGGNTGNRPPIWAVGNFRARNPQSGGWIYLTVNSNGQATVSMDGNFNYGSLYGTVFSFQGATANVFRNGNGLRMQRSDNGETIYYYRN